MSTHTCMYCVSEERGDVRLDRRIWGCVPTVGDPLYGGASYGINRYGKVSHATQPAYAINNNLDAGMQHVNQANIGWGVVIEHYEGAWELNCLLMFNDIPKTAVSSATFTFNNTTTYGDVRVGDPPDTFACRLYGAAEYPRHRMLMPVGYNDDTTMTRESHPEYFKSRPYEYRHWLSSWDLEHTENKFIWDFATDPFIDKGIYTSGDIAPIINEIIAKPWFGGIGSPLALIISPHGEHRDKPYDGTPDLTDEVIPSGPFNQTQFPTYLWKVFFWSNSGTVPPYLTLTY